jgi:hypothetical protein
MFILAAATLVSFGGRMPMEISKLISLDGIRVLMLPVVTAENENLA